MKSVLSQFKSYNGLTLFILYTFIVVPATVLHYNPKVFQLSLQNYYGHAVVGVTLLLLALWFINKFYPSFVEKTNQICIILGLYISITNFVFPINTGLLDGIHDVFYFTFNKEILLQFIIPFILMVSIILIKLYHEKLIQNFVYLSILFGIIWISYTTIADVQAQSHSSNILNNEQLLQKNYDLSADKNILVISFDGLQGNYVRDVLEEYPEYKSLLDGFVFFSDTVATATKTFLSLQNTLSGKIADTHYEHEQELFDALGNDNFIRDAELSGFNTSIYSLDDNFCTVISHCLHQGSMQIQNLFSEYSDISYRKLLQISTMRYIPSLLLAPYHAVSKKFESGHEQVLNVLDDSNYLDYLFFNDFIDKLSVNSESPVLKMQHYLITHEPFQFDEHCNYLDSEDTPQNVTSMKKQITCGLNSFVQLIKKLKQLGVYDNSLIIFTSDHGYQVRRDIPVVQQNNKTQFIAGANFPNDDHTISRFNATLFFKPFGSSGLLDIKDEPVSLLDIRATVCQYLSQCDATQLTGYLLESPIPVNRERSVLAYSGGIKQINQRRGITKYYKRVMFQGPFTNMSDKLVKGLFPLDVGDKLEFSNANTNYFIAKGLSWFEDSGSWTDGKVAFILFNPSTRVKQQDVQLQLSVIPYINVLHPQLSVKFYINNELIKTEEFTYNPQTTSQKNVELDVPKILVNQQEQLELKLEINDPISPYQLDLSMDERLLGLFVQEVKLATI